MSLSPAKVHIRYTSNGGGTTRQEIAGFCYGGIYEAVVKQKQQLDAVISRAAQQTEG